MDTNWYAAHFAALADQVARVVPNILRDVEKLRDAIAQGQPLDRFVGRPAVVTLQTPPRDQRVRVEDPSRFEYFFIRGRAGDCSNQQVAQAARLLVKAIGEGVVDRPPNLYRQFVLSRETLPDERDLESDEQMEVWWDNEVIALLRLDFPRQFLAHPENPWAVLIGRYQACRVLARVLTSDTAATPISADPGLDQYDLIILKAMATQKDRLWYRDDLEQRTKKLGSRVAARTITKHSNDLLQHGFIEKVEGKKGIRITPKGLARLEPDGN
ncbi:MAG: hypothetical protein ACOC9P_01815 [bacterium]